MIFDRQPYLRMARHFFVAKGEVTEWSSWQRDHDSRIISTETLS